MSAGPDFGCEEFPTCAYTHPLSLTLRDNRLTILLNFHETLFSSARVCNNILF